MISNKITTLVTSQEQPAYVWHHTQQKHFAGNTVRAHVKLPKTMAHDGFPVEQYHVSVTPSQACSVHVVNKARHGFDVVLTSLDATPLVEGQFSVMVIG